MQHTVWSPHAYSNLGAVDPTAAANSYSNLNKCTPCTIASLWVTVFANSLYMLQALVPQLRDETSSYPLMIAGCSVWSQDGSYGGRACRFHQSAARNSITNGYIARKSTQTQHYPCICFQRHGHMMQFCLAYCGFTCYLLLGNCGFTCYLLLGRFPTNAFNP